MTARDKSAETLAATPTPAANALALPATSPFDPAVERFSVGAELGRGGMGVVVAATDQTLEREVAIKQALSNAPEDLARFEREVRITARLEHPSIVPIHDVGRDADGRPYYIMRRIAGDPLSTRVGRTQRVRDRLALLPNVLAAVDAAAFAHARGVIHRDIKPWNILIGEFGETLLIDWGLARRLDEGDEVGALVGEDERPAELTVAGLAYGTPGYMAPEQARGERADARADVYALGATLFHVLSGRPLVTGTAAAAAWIERARARAIELPLEELSDEVPRELVAILAKATAGDPAARYADAGALATDLRAFLAGQLVGAHRYTIVERLRRFVTKHRIAVATAAIAAVALLAGGMIAIGNIVHERDRANVARGLADQRAEQSLLDRASTLATIDPTRAVALLRHAPPSLRARDIAANAAAHGIAHGLVAHAATVYSVALSADGKRLASGDSAGKLVIHELATRRSHVVTIPGAGTISMITWIDNDRALVLLAEAGIHRYDIASGALTRIGPGVPIGRIWIVGDHVRYLGDNQLFEVDIAGGPPRAIAQADDVACAGPVTLVDSATSLRVIDERGERVLVEHGPPPLNRALAISRDGTRLAALVIDEVIEWDRATAQIVRRWAKQQAQRLFYAGTNLYSIDLRGRLDELGSHSIVNVLPSGTAKVVQVSPFDHGVYVAANDGIAAMIDDDRRLSILTREPGTRTITTDAAGETVAVGSNDGTIRWWNTRDFLPRTFAVPAQTTVCAADHDYVYSTGGLQLFGSPRDGSPVRPYDAEAEDCMLANDWIVTFARNYSTAAAIHRTTHAPMRVGVAIMVDPETRNVIYVDATGVIYELHDQPIRRGTASAVTDLSARGGWIVVVTARELVRLSPSGVRSTIRPDRRVELVTIGGTGIVWFTVGHDIYRWDRTITKLATAPADVVRIAGGSADAAGVQLRDATLWWLRADGTMVLRARSNSRGDLSSFGRRVTALRHPDGIEQIYLDTGEHVVRNLNDLAIRIVLEDKDRRIVVQTPGDRGYEFLDPVPMDPNALGAWIDQATNAELNTSTDSLTWRE